MRLRTLSKPTTKDIDNIIRWLAGRMCERFGESISKDDLIQEGWIAAIKAKESYREGRGTKLTTWITCNVWGALRTIIQEQFLDNRKLSFVGDSIGYDESEADEEPDEQGLMCFWTTEKLLSPVAKRLVAIQKEYFLRRSDCIRVKRKEDVCKELGVTSRELAGIYREIRQGLTLVSGFVFDK